jgi:hypothetical protein
MCTTNWGASVGGKGVVSWSRERGTSATTAVSHAIVDLRAMQVAQEQGTSVSRAVSHTLPSDPRGMPTCGEGVTLPAKPRAAPTVGQQTARRGGE